MVEEQIAKYDFLGTVKSIADMDVSSLTNSIGKDVSEAIESACLSTKDMPDQTLATTDLLHITSAINANLATKPSDTSNPPSTMEVGEKIGTLQSFYVNIWLEYLYSKGTFTSVTNI